MENAGKTRILFVDDEPQVLKMLQLTLRSISDDWEMMFVESGAAALEILTQTPVDVVVSDMRMPGMSGAELLNEVMKRQPQTVRIILSGYADEEMVMKCVGATHQYLSKPFDPKSLKSSLNRINNLRLQMTNKELVSAVSGMKSMPSIPSMYFQIIDALQSPNASVQLIGEIVSTDAGLTAKILQMVNSAYFGFANSVSSAEEAVQLLGVGRIRSLALCAHIFSTFDKSALPQNTLDEIWHHSLVTGMAARRIAEMEGCADALIEQAFTGGLLHDIGKLILAANRPTEYLEVEQKTRTEKRVLTEVEQEFLNVNHAQVGAYLLGIWGLPMPLVEAVAWHHTPSLAEVPEFSALTAVHAANVLVLETNRTNKELPLEFDAGYLGQMALTERVSFWREQLATQ